MKKFALKAAIIAIAGYLGVVGYVHQYDKGQMEKLLAEGNYSAEQQKIAKVFFNNGCQYCHTPSAELPFYARIPLVDSMMQNDIKGGNRVFLLNKLLEGLKNPSKLSEVDFAKLERVIENGEMPIAKFRHIHWGSRPDEDEKTTLLNWIREQRKAFLPVNTKGTDNNRLVQPIPDAIMTDPAKVALGRKLFKDGRLSTDGTIQCHTCHQLDKGGVDRLDVSTGVEGKKGGINAPTVFNAAFNFVQFWDGRAIDLADQAGGPPVNPVEMGSHTWNDIVAKFEQDEEFKKEFLQIYPEVTQATLTHAIGEYEKTLITPNSDFDRYLKSDKTALNAQQLKGYELFKQHKCDTCHTGVNMGGQSYDTWVFTVITSKIVAHQSRKPTKVVSRKPKIRTICIALKCHHCVISH